MKPNIKPVQKDFYLNPIAQLHLLSDCSTKVLIAGRGFGKSFVNGVSVCQKVEKLPRSKGILIGLTYTQILGGTLIPMKAAWAWYGYHENIHYVVGKKPPEHFEKPYHAPSRFENVVTFWNGTTMVLGSFDRPQLIRSGSYDWEITDEAFLINKIVYNEVVIPTQRATDIRLKDKPGSQTVEYTSSMPRGALGSWLLEKELEAENPKNDISYLEGTSWHNVEVLGKKVLLKWKRSMNKINYLVEVMNKRIKNFGSVFYPAFDAEIHTYFDGYNYDYIDTLGTNLDLSKQYSRWDKDCNPEIPLNISLDFGTFNCMTVDQEVWPYRNWLNYFHGENPVILDDVVDKFINYYKHHRNKIVFIWGDKSGNKREPNARLSLFEQVAKRLRAAGWRPVHKTRKDVDHLERHNFIVVLMNEEDPRFFKNRFNSIHCKDLIIAIESAGMKKDRKDKDSEGNPAIKQEHATHGTDALDYRLWWGELTRKKQSDNKPTPASFGG